MIKSYAKQLLNFLRSYTDIDLHFLVLLSAAFLCFWSHFDVALVASQSCTGGPLILINIREDKCGTVIQDLIFVHTKLVTMPNF